jgi:multiple sugar transport system substrate-binding protein
VTWNNPDNNKQFHAQHIIMTVNDTLSITNALRADRPDDYYKNTVTIQWPNGLDGKPPAIENSVYPVLVFKDAQNATAAREFVAFLLSEGRLGGFNEASLGRVLPPMPALLETPFWQDAKDPHRTAAISRSGKARWPTLTSRSQATCAMARPIRCGPPPFAALLKRATRPTRPSTRRSRRSRRSWHSK